MVISGDKLSNLNSNAGIKKPSLKRRFSSYTSCEEKFTKEHYCDLFNGKPAITAALLKSCDVQDIKMKTKNPSEAYETIYSPVKLSRVSTLPRDIKNLEISRSFTKQGSPALNKSAIRSVKATSEKTTQKILNSPVMRRIKKVKTVHSRSPSCGNLKQTESKHDAFSSNLELGSPLKCTFNTPSKRRSLSTWIKRRSSQGFASFSKDSDKRRQSLSSVGNNIKTVDQFFNSPAFRKNNSSNAVPEPHLEDVINHKVGRKLFHEFLKREYSEENLEFWLECETFKSLPCSKQGKQAMKIYERFIETNSSMEVNLDAPTRTFLAADIEYPSSEMFEEAQRQIFKLMQRDSYPRFVEHIRRGHA